jgi:hypothetical protein
MITLIKGAPSSDPGSSAGSLLPRARRCNGPICLASGSLLAKLSAGAAAMARSAWRARAAREAQRSSIDADEALDAARAPRADFELTDLGSANATAMTSNTAASAAADLARAPTWQEPAVRRHALDVSAVADRSTRDALIGIDVSGTPRPSVADPLTCSAAARMVAMLRGGGGDATRQLGQPVAWPPHPIDTISALTQ